MTARRCAIYTRKSSEEGLQQDFNSLDAQRAACAAYIKSQAGEGWRTVDTRYDDGGFSGGSMERPALKRLLAEIAAGKVDVVAVYKIDRLTRALSDFVRIVELFDQHGVSFVSVTQAFNTTSSMGRLMLNVLLSFAQFEREVTGERIRDKIAASKARGMWMGGNLPLGYDMPEEGRRALVLNPQEAETVRAIFATYLELGSVSALERWLVERRIASKRRTSVGGRTLGGGSFNRGALFYMLRNQVYLGMIVHRGKVHPGMHPAIVDPDLFQAVQDRLDANQQQRAARRDRVARAPLTGRIFDADGRPMSPTFSYGRRKNLYRYYVSAPLQQGKRRSDGDETLRRVPAPALEARLTSLLRRVVPAASTDPLDLPSRVEIRAQSVHLLLPIGLVGDFRDRLLDGEEVEPDRQDSSQLRLILHVRMQLHGGRTWLIGAADAAARPDPVLIKALRSAHAMLGRDAAGEPVIEAIPPSPYHRKLLRLAFLAPDLQRAILLGRQPQGLTLKRLLQQSPPLRWEEQVRAIDLGTGA
jgi:site-specific DNA recombinase